MFPKKILLLFGIKELNVANHCYPAIASPDIHAPPPHKPQAVNWRGEKIWRLFCAPFLIVMPSIPWDIYFTGLSSGCNTHIAPHSINTVVAGRDDGPRCTGNRGIEGKQERRRDIGELVYLRTI